MYTYRHAKIRYIVSYNPSTSILLQQKRTMFSQPFPKRKHCMRRMQLPKIYQEKRRQNLSYIYCILVATKFPMSPPPTSKYLAVENPTSSARSCNCFPDQEETHNEKKDNTAYFQTYQGQTGFQVTTFESTLALKYTDDKEQFYADD